MANTVGRQRQFELDCMLLPFESMASLGVRVAASQ